MYRQHQLSQRLLRPRDLVTHLFAEALDGDAVADDHLRHLAVDDPAAAAAFEELVVAEIETRFRDGG